MNSHRQIAVIVPEPMLSAFSVLIDSTRNQRLLASSDNLDELRISLGEKKPDVILVYLVQESGLDNEKGPYEIIARVKDSWHGCLLCGYTQIRSTIGKGERNWI